MFNQKEKQDITFIAQIEGMLGDPLIQPQPAHKYIPDWWKSIPAWYSDNVIYEAGVVKKEKPTAKQCPSFIHYFSAGYVLPAWCDIKLSYNQETNIYSWETGRTGSPYTIDTHDNEQLLNHVDFNYLGRKPTLVFKTNTPWLLKTPKNWSVLQMPMFYNINDDFMVMVGVINTDKWHEINLQIMYFGEGKDVVIPKGTPLVQFIPYKQEKLKLITKMLDEVERLKFRTSWLKVVSKKSNGYIMLGR